MWPVVLLLLFCLAAHLADGQAGVGKDHQPVGAYRVYPKTNFSCNDRPAGYYADVETDCQIYHMCDGMGRQFSYSCPNTTLFQQRMLICDHWYMVNCAKAEDDYFANLLIGQRDKPFVSELENELRTPRPDLLDRPYSSDYSGESFRKQYKKITETNSIAVRPKEVEHNAFTVSSTVKPFQADPTKHQSQTNRRSDTSGDIDLGVSSSQDRARSKPESVFEHRSTEAIRRRQDISAGLQAPSIYYSPPRESPTYFPDNRQAPAPFSQPRREPQINVTTKPSFNEKFATTTQRPTQSMLSTVQSTIPPTRFMTPRSTKKLLTVTTPQRTVKITSPTTPKPNLSVVNIFKNTILTSPNSRSFTVSTETPKLETKKPSPLIIYRHSPPDFSVSGGQLPSGFMSSIVVKQPSTDLLAPHEKFISPNEDATEGPPIYFKWKIPANGLEPPIDPTAVNNEHSTLFHTKQAVELSPLQPFSDALQAPNNADTPTQSRDELKTAVGDFAHLPKNPFNVIDSVQKLLTTDLNRAPTPRSIPFDPQQTFGAITSGKSVVSAEKANNFNALQKKFLIPDFVFPLEVDGRDGYERSENRNSFQLKIPLKHNDEPWYGENPQCPECHPSFVNPGMCKPCIKIR